MISRVKYFLEHGQEDLAHKIVGEYLLANVRGAVTVGLAVEETLWNPSQNQRPTVLRGKKGKKGSKTSGRKPGGRKHWQQQAQ